MSYDVGKCMRDCANQSSYLRGDLPKGCIPPSCDEVCTASFEDANFEDCISSCIAGGCGSRKKCRIYCATLASKIGKYGPSENYSGPQAGIGVL